MLTVVSGLAAAATDPPATLLAQVTVEGGIRGSWLQSTLIFLLITAAGGYGWYFGLFPRLLRKSHPSWPLDAWRHASYGAWLTMCFAAWFFKKPLVSALTPFLRGTVNDTLIAYFVEVILVPILALVGILVIWNFRRDVTNRARPSGT